MNSKWAYITGLSLLISFTACDRNNSVATSMDAQIRSLFATLEKTRTTVAEDGSMTWNGGDKLAVFHKESIKSSYTNDGTFSIVNVKTGQADSDREIVLDEGISYDWFVFFPTGSISNPESVPVSIPSTQTQKSSGDRSNLAGSSPLYGFSKSTGTESPTIQMHQLASGIQITVKNASPARISLASVMIGSESNLAGSFSLDFSSGEPVWTTMSGEKSATLNSGGITIKKGEAADLFLLLAPCTVTGTITIEVTTEAGVSQTFEKNVSGLEFAAGVINSTTVEFTEAEPVVPGEEPAAFGACPSEAQVTWQRQELIMFYHFGPATFSGYDGEKANYSSEELISQYKPETVNAEQWISVAAENGFKEVILTAKHHDGFSLWDNPESTCDVAACPEEYRTDVVKAVSDAAKAKGLGFGIYMSPWDKVNGNSPDYGSRYISAIHSVADGAYGTLTEFWLDGNNAASLDFSAVNSAIYEKNPHCIIFSNVGPGCRWVGNENGEAGETNWSTFSPGKHNASQTSLQGDYGTYLAQGDQGGEAWIPAECDLSIRPIGDDNGWFWGENETPKSAKELLDVYYKSVGRNSVMLLNVPPTRDGVLDAADVAVLEQFHAYLSGIFGENLASGASVDEDESTPARGTDYAAQNVLDGNEATYWAVKSDDTKSATLVLDLGGEKTFNVVSLQEYINKGQRVTGFTIEYYANGSWHSFTSGTTIGAKRLLKREAGAVTASQIRLSFTSLACPLINEVGLYVDNN